MTAGTVFPKSAAGGAMIFFVIAGLDPAIHAESSQL
jgi:hypothetical protein